MKPTDHITLIRRKKELLPKVGEFWAKNIFEEIFQGDALADEIDDLLCDLFDIEGFESPDEHVATDEDITEMVWLNILNQLHALVHDNLTNPPKFPSLVRSHESSTAFTPIQ